MEAIQDLELIQDVLYVDCILCGGDQHTLLHEIVWKGFNFRIVKCINCGLVFTNPQPNQSFLVQLYTKNYYQSTDSFIGYTNYQEEYEKRLQRFRTYLDLSSEGLRTKRIRILDVGAGFGFLLSEASLRGWAVCGIELSDYARMKAKELFNLYLLPGDLINIEFGSEEFNLITFVDVIEHVRNPRRELELVHHLLTDDGLLMVRVPVIDSVEGSRKGADFYKIDHFYNFNSSSFLKLLDLSAFKVMQMINEPAHIVVFAKKF